MAERISGPRLAALLWFVAAALAWIAVGIRYYRGRELSWPWMLAGLFCLAMGLSARKRGQPGTSERENRDRNPPA